MITIKEATGKGPGVVDLADAEALAIAVKEYARTPRAIEQPLGVFERDKASLGDGLAALANSGLSPRVKCRGLDDEAFAAMAAPAPTLKFSCYEA